MGRRRCARRSRPVRRCGGRALITRRTMRLLPRSGAARSPAPSADAGRLCSALFALNMNDLPARIDSDETAIGRPTPTARRLVEASVSPNTRRAYAGALRRLDAWLDGARARRRGAGRLRRRTARRRPRLVERLDGGRRDVLPREARRAAHSRRRADRPGAGRLSADCWRSGARTSAAVRGLGPSGCAGHVPSAALGAVAASSPRRSLSSVGVSMP